jgi:hypothetical protein
MTVSVTLNDESAVEVLAPVVATAPAHRFGAVTIIDERHATVLDSTGRALKVKRLSALDRVRLFRAMGAVDAENRMISSYAATAAAVVEIDGHPVPFPQSSISLDALIARLDEHGLACAIEALIALSPKADDVATEAKKS